MLQSEYLGRKMTTSGLVATGAMITVGGNMTGSGAWMSLQRNGVLFNWAGNLHPLW